MPEPFETLSRAEDLGLTVVSLHNLADDLRGIGWVRRGAYLDEAAEALAQARAREEKLREALQGAADGKYPRLDGAAREWARAILVQASLPPEGPAASEGAE